jgi:hypothetical protein
MKKEEEIEAEAIARMKSLAQLRRGGKAAGRGKGAAGPGRELVKRTFYLSPATNSAVDIEFSKVDVELGRAIRKSEYMEALCQVALEHIDEVKVRLSQLHRRS